MCFDYKLIYYGCPGYTSALQGNSASGCRRRLQKDESIINAAKQNKSPQKVPSLFLHFPSMQSVPGGQALTLAWSQSRRVSHLEQNDFFTTDGNPQIN